MAGPQIPHEHRLLIQELLDLAVPPSGLFGELMMRTRPDILLAEGLLHRACRYLKASLALDDAGLLDVADAQARTIYEYAATGVWILEDQKNFEMFARAHLRHLRLVDATFPSFAEGFLEATRELLQHEFGSDEEGRLIGLEQRLPHSMRDGLYFLYRDLSERVHPTLLSAMLLLTEDEEGNIQFAQDVRKDFRAQDYPLLGCLSVNRLAMQIESELGVDGITPMTELGVRMVSLVMSYLGEDAESSTEPDADVS